MQLAADCLLDRMLCNLQNGEETVRTVQQLMHFIVSDTGITKTFSRFLGKIKKDPSCLSKCSHFHKRILMFVVVQCILIGENPSYTYTDENLTPLENALNRLSDIAVALESEIDDHEAFYEIWMQTLKQAVLVLLENKQTVEASKILVVYRDKLVERQREVLEKFIHTCSKNPNIIKVIRGTEGHNYSSYCVFVCEYLKDLNSRLEKTTVYKLVEKIYTSLPDAAAVDGKNASSVSSDSADEDDITLLSSQGSSSILPRLTDSTEYHPAECPNEKPSDMPLSDGIQQEDSDSDISSASRLFEKQQQKDALHNTASASTIEEARAAENVTEFEAEAAAHKNVPQHLEDSDDSVEIPWNRGISRKANPSKMIPIDPKVTLAYRLRKQSAAFSGINIPCQHIVSNCRKVHGAEEESEDNFDFPGKRMTSTPVKASHNPFKPATVQARELLLGDRYEAAKQTGPLTGTRNYSTNQKKKGAFNIELDSYILAGCRHFGVGSWQNVLKAFPFPSWASNVKIKDRFRTLMKRHHVAMLDDGDFSVLDSELKAKMPLALEKLKKVDVTSGVAKSDKTERPGARRDGMATNNEDVGSTSKAQPSSDRPSAKDNLKRQGHLSESDDLTIMSTTSSQSKTPERKENFTRKEDGCIVCGVRYLGFNWLRIKQSFDFSPQVSITDIKSRWHALVKQGKVVRDNEEGGIQCRAPDLQEFSVEAETVLKKKIQAQRRSFPVNSSSVREQDHESDASSNTPERSMSPVLSRPRHNEAVPNDMNLVRETALEDDRNANAHGPTNPPGLKIRSSRHKHTLDSDDESVPTTSTPSKDRSMCSDAGTQTKRRKLVLGGPSPGMLDASSDSELRDERSPFQVGSPIRPSRINHFKPGVRKAKSVPGGRPKKGKLSPTTQDQRSKRQRELLWKQRRKAPATRNPWSQAETNQILQGLSKHGPGKWSEILDDGWEVFRDRTSVMIKDKFRSMMKSNQIPEDIVLLCDAQKAAKE